jgi:hypothetical protein
MTRREQLVCEVALARSYVTEAAKLVLDAGDAGQAEREQREAYLGRSQAMLAKLERALTATDAAA